MGKGKTLPQSMPRCRARTGQGNRQSKGLFFPALVRWQYFMLDKQLLLTLQGPGSESIVRDHA